MLQQEEEAKKRRKQAETKIELDRIQDRISHSLRKYEQENESSKPTAAAAVASITNIPSKWSSASERLEQEISLSKIQDPLKLYELLDDENVRSKYEERLMVVLMNVEQAKEEQEKLLQSLDDFFVDTQATSRRESIEKIASEQIDLTEATSNIESALDTATEAASRLVEIKHEMGQLLSVATQFSDNKKGRRKLEKALVKAQEDVKALTEQLEGAQTDLVKNKSLYKDLQKTIETKTAECAELKKTSNQAVILQRKNDKLTRELADATVALESTKKEVEQLRNSTSVTTMRQIEPVADQDRVSELEEALAASNAAQEELTNKMKQEQEAHQAEIASLQTKHTEEVAELQATHQEQIDEQLARHEEQLHSLVEFDVMQEEESEDKIDEPSPNIEEAVDSSSQEAIADLKAELQRLKTKSKAKVAALQGKLTESQNRLDKELAAKNETIESLKARLGELEILRQVSEDELVKGLEQQNSRHQERCQQHLATIKELEVALKQMKETNKKPSSPPLVEVVKELVDHSTQWSQASSHSCLSSIHGVDRITITPKSATPLHDSSLVSAVGSPVGNSAAVMSEISQLSPLLPLGSAVSLAVESLCDVQPQFPGMLPAQPKQELLSLNHPIVAEWTKTYELFRKFNNTIKERLAMIGGKNAAEELPELDSFSLDANKDLVGQITQKRFTLTLSLHQLEASLQECLTLPELRPIEISSEKEGSGGGEVDHLKLQISKLQELLKQRVDQYHYELKDNKDTITNLSLRIESLKTELSSVRQRVCEQQAASTGVTFFTQLDKDRNEEALQQAVTSQQLSEQEYSTISSNMEEYLSIPMERLTNITRQLAYTKQCKSTITEVEESLQPRHAARVIGMIEQLRKKRQDEFVARMKELSTRRRQLSVDLQCALTKVEGKVGLLLIKPIFPVKPGQPLIVPIRRRPPPSRRPMTTAGYAPRPQSHRVTTSGHQPTRTWSVASSRGQSTSIPCSPVLPRLVEMDTHRLRELRRITRQQSSSAPPPSRLPIRLESGRLPPIHISVNS